MTRDRWVILALLVAVLLLNTFAWAALPVPYKWFSPPTKTKVCVQVQWVTPQKAADICKGGSACWFPSATGHHDLIVATQPKDFNDEWALMILGHELFHALGAKHD